MLVDIVKQLDLLNYILFWKEWGVYVCGLAVSIGGGIKLLQVLRVNNQEIIKQRFSLI